MRIHFISGSLLPSMEASAVNVMQTCAALAQEGHEVTLFARRNGTDDVDTVLARYGVPKAVRLVLLGSPVPPRDLWIRKEDGVDRNLRYPLSVLRALRALPPPDLIYGRHLYSMLLATLAMPEVPMVFELHQLRSNRIGRLAERWLFQRPSFIGAAAISEALIADYRALYADLAGLDADVGQTAAALQGLAAALAQLQGTAGEHPMAIQILSGICTLRWQSGQHGAAVDACARAAAVSVQVHGPQHRTTLQAHREYASMLAARCAREGRTGADARAALLALDTQVQAALPGESALGDEIRTLRQGCEPSQDDGTATGPEAT